MFFWVRRSVSFLCIFLFSLTISSQVSEVKQSAGDGSNREFMRVREVVITLLLSSRKRSRRKRSEEAVRRDRFQSSSRYNEAS